MGKYNFLPDMSDYPDCEEKRIIMNLAQQLENKLVQMDGEQQNIDKYHEDANKIYWELNAKMGALCYKMKKEAIEAKRFVWPLILSIAAFIISLLALILNL